MEAPRTNYILIDHENVHALDPGEIVDIPVRVLVFLGEQTTKLAVKDVQKLLAHPGKIELITISGHGKNALDFHVAYYAGRISVEDPKAYIHIVSKDKGFDPLVVHLKTHRGIFAKRSETVPDLRPVLHREAHAESVSGAAQGSTAPASPSAIKLVPPTREERLARVLSQLTKSAKNRPRKRETLKTSINALFQKQLSEAEVKALVKALEKSGKLSINDKDAVTYQL